MSVAATVSIDRSSLSKAALTIGGAGSGTYTLTSGGLGRPAMTPRYTYAPDSPDMHGSSLLQVVKEQSSLPLEVLVSAATSAALRTAEGDLEEALWQFSYNTTVTVDGVSTTWACNPAAWSLRGGVVDHGHAEQHFSVYAITIPVFPIGA